MKPGAASRPVAPPSAPQRVDASGGARIVDARDVVDARIAGHAGVAYCSPPQPRAAALALVALLVGGR